MSYGSLSMRDEDLRRRLAQNAGRAPARRAPAQPVARAVPVPAAAAPAAKPVADSASSKSSWKMVIIGVSLLVLASLAGGGVFWWRSQHKGHTLAATTNPLAQQLSSLVSIPVYAPLNLPAGYTYNDDAKAVKSTIMYFSVTGPGNQKFYISEQPIPPNFNFEGFAKKYLNPSNFSSDAGNGAAGTLANQLVGSIQTNKNTWIIINSPASNSLTELETVARSLELTK